MNVEQMPGSLLLFATVLLGLVLMMIVWPRRRAPGVFPFLLFMLASTLWALCDGIEHITRSPEVKIIFARLSYLGISTLPVFWLLFTVQYARKYHWLKGVWRKALLFAIPAVTVALAWTNDFHRLLWADIRPIAGMMDLEYVHGPWFWLVIAYSYACLLAGSVVLITSTRARFPLFYRSQAVVLVSGLLFPWACNLVYISGLNPLPGIDLTPFGFFITGLFCAISLFRLRLFSLLPIAREAVIETMSDGVLVLDQAFTIADANQAAAAMLGVASRDLIGRPAEGLLPLEPEYFKPPEGPKPDPVELEMALPLTPPSILDLKISPITAGSGASAGWLILMRNITNQKRMEEELRKARDQAETSNRYKSEFLANMSHEIRTPMNAVIGMTSLLLDTPMTDEQRDWLEIIRNSSEALLGIINDILDYSRIESGKLPLEQQAFSLRGCIEESLDVIAMRAAEKNLELLYEVDDDTPETVTGDAMRLRQVLVNLLNNAVKFTASGEVFLSVRPGAAVNLEEDPAHPGQKWMEVRFAVRDTGIGISEDRIDRLFQPFNQVDSSITRRFGGSGLGLAISKRLVEMMGGQIWVESAPKQGSTFSFSAWLSVPAVIPGEGPGERTDRFAGKRLLIVDANELSQRILVSLAEKAGVEARAVCSVDEAIAGQKPLPRAVDALMVDRRVDGLDRLAAHFPGVPLVLMSPPSRTGITGKLSWRARLQKPVRPARFYAALARAFTPPNEAQAKEPGMSANGGANMARPEVLTLPEGIDILVAEDNLANQRVAQLVLRKLGYEADIVSDGAQVLAALERKTYHVILMDVQMPEMDGLETSRSIRRTMPDSRQPYIIAMTASVMSGDKDRCLSAGMNDFIGKPVRAEELVRALARSRPARSAPAENQPDSEPGIIASSGWRAGANHAAIDRAVLDELVQLMGKGGRGSVAEVAALFRSNTGVLVDDLEASLARLDLESVRRLAHTVKSAGGNLGAEALADRALWLEDLARELCGSEPDGSAPLVTPRAAADLSAAIEQVGVEFRRACDELARLGY